MLMTITNQFGNIDYWVNVMKLFSSSLTMRPNKLYTDKPFQPGLVFVGKESSLPYSWARRKGQPGINALINNVSDEENIFYNKDY